MNTIKQFVFFSLASMLFITQLSALSEADKIKAQSGGVVGDVRNGQVTIIDEDGVPTPFGSGGNKVKDIAISSDNRAVFSLSEDGKVIVIKNGDTKATGFDAEGDFIAITPDSRTAFVGSKSKLTSYNLFDESTMNGTRSVMQAQLTVINDYKLPDDVGDMKAMAIRPDGESLYAVFEKPSMNSATPGNDIAIVYFDIANHVGASQVPIFFLQKTYAYEDSVALEDASVTNITDIAISPDGNLAFITARGSGGAQSTPFGVIPTSDELTGGVIVVDLNTLTQIDFIPTSLRGENTKTIRDAIAKKASHVRSPVVQFWNSRADDALDRADIGSRVSLSVGAGVLGTEAAVYVQASTLYERAYKDLGIISAYSDMYPTDMVGANGIGINGRGDLAVVSMLSTNNFGFIPLSLSSDVRGYGSGNLTDFYFSSATERIVNSLSLDSLPVDITGVGQLRDYMGPADVSFSGDSSLAIIGMRGGVGSSTQNGNYFGVLDLATHQNIIFSGDDGRAITGISPGVVDLKQLIEHKYPQHSAAFHAIDIDGDTFSNHLEAFNRWNDYKKINFGDSKQLVSTNELNVSNPSQVPINKVFPSNQADKGYLLPHSGLGYRFNYSGHAEYSVNAGSALAVSTIEEVGRLWHAAFLKGDIDRPYFVVMNMSHPGGGLLRNEKGELVHLNVRNGYQANFAYLQDHTDESYDIVISNDPSNPTNNFVQSLGFNIVETNQLVQFLLDQPTVLKVIVDPLLYEAEKFDSSDSRIEVSGNSSAFSTLRRDHDSFFRVLFGAENGVQINADDAVTTVADAIVVQDPDVLPSGGRSFSFNFNIQNSDAKFVKVSGAGATSLFYTQTGATALGSDFISVDRLKGALWSSSNTDEIIITLYDADEIPLADVSPVTYTPKTLSININEVTGLTKTPSDADGDGIPDYADGFNLDNSSSGDFDNNFIKDEVDDSAPVGHFKDFNISINGDLDRADAYIRISYDASFPGSVTRTVSQNRLSSVSTDHVTTYQLPSSGGLRLWRNNDDRRTLGDFIGPGQYSLSELFPDAGNANGGTLYIEAVTDINNAPIEVAIDPDGLEGPLGYVTSDLEYVNPGGSLSISLENNAPVIASDFGSSDNGIPDFADFSGTPHLIFPKLSLNVPTATGKDAKVGLSYSASDPAGLSTSNNLYFLPSGHLRAWKSGAASNRTNLEQQYVAPGSYDANDLPETLFIEGVVPSSALLDQEISISFFSGEGVVEQVIRKDVPDSSGYRDTERAFIVENVLIPGTTQEASLQLTVEEGAWLDTFAVDADHRKFDINGQPIADPEPQAKVERDLKKNGFYVDAYSLTPVFSKTDISIPLLGEKLALEFRRTTSVDTFITGPGAYPIEAVGPDTLLGNGWRTNIGARVQIKDGIYTVFDENGQRHRYTKAGTPIPHSFQEASTHRTEIAITEDEFNPNLIGSVVWTNNYWTEYYFEGYDAAQSEFGKRPIVGQVLRLKYIRDRNGNGIRFVYENFKSYPDEMHEVTFEKGVAGGLTWNVSKDASKLFTSKKITFAYTNVPNFGLRLDLFKDPKGNTYDFNYSNDNRLGEVMYPTGGGKEVYDYFSDSKELEGTSMSLNFAAVSSFENRNENTVTFDYEVTRKPTSLNGDKPWHAHLTKITTPTSSDGSNGVADFSFEGLTPTKTITEIADSAGTLLTNTFTTGFNSASLVDGGGLSVYGMAIPYLSKMERKFSDTEKWTAEFSPDTYCNLLKLTDLNGVVTAYTYGVNGGFANTIYGRPSERVLDEGGPNAVSSKYTYDHENRMSAGSTLPNGLIIEKKFDESNRNPSQVDVKWKEGAAPNLPIYDSSFGYLAKALDSDGRLTHKEKIIEGNGWKVITKFFQGYHDNLNGDGNLYYTKTSTYDLNGNLVEEKFVDAVAGSQPFVTNHHYDAVNNRFKTELPTVAGGRPTLQWTHEPLGQIAQATDARGTVTTYAYDDRENLISTSTPVSGANTVINGYKYDSIGRKTEQTDPNGNTSTFVYDRYNRLTEQNIDTSGNEPVNAQTAFEYLTNSGRGFFAGDSWKPTKITDPIGMETTMNYTSTYYLSSKIQMGGPLGGGTKTETYEVDILGNITKIIIDNAVGSGQQEITMKYDLLNRMTKRTAPEGIVTETKYDYAGNVVAQIDGEGYTFQTEYGSMGQVLKTVQWMNVGGPKFTSQGYYAYMMGVPANDDIYQTFTVDGRGNRIESTLRRYENGLTGLVNIKTAYEYDGLNRLLSTTQNAGTDLERVTTFTHDFNSNVLTETLARGDMEIITSYDYDAINRRTKMTLPAVTDGEGTGGTNEYEYTYDANSNVLVETDPRNTTTTYTYDGLNRVLTTTLAGNAAAAIVTEFTYDANGNVLTTTLEREVDIVTTNLYDGFNRITESTDAESNKTQYSSYDNLDNLLSQIDPRGNATTYAYDKVNRLVTTTLPPVSPVITGPGVASGSFTTVKTYDKRNLLLTETDPNGHLHTYAYDGAGRKLSYQNPDNDTQFFAYDQASNLVSETDFKGQPTLSFYDRLNRRTSVEDRADHTTSFEYDFANNVTKVTDPKGEDSVTVYDALNRSIQITQRGNSASTYIEYNLTGAVTKTTDENGNTTESTYDGFNRVLTSIDGEGNPTTFTYDQANNLLTQTDALGQVTKTVYDKINRVSTVTEAHGSPLAKTTTYTYDPNSNRTSILDANGNSTGFDYDELNRITVHTLPTTKTYKFGYDKEANRIATETPNGEMITQVFDVLERMTSKTYEGYTYSYTYDENSNLLTNAATINGVNGIGFTSNVTHTYEARDLLSSTSVDYPGATAKSATYNYDANGNYDNATSYNGRNIDYTTNARDQYTIISGVFGVHGTIQSDYTYDPALRLTNKDYDNGVATQYSYDKRNLALAKVATNTSSQEINRNEYRYDAVGKRLFEKNSFSDPDNATTFITTADVYNYDALYRVIGTKYKVPASATTGTISSSSLPTDVAGYGTITKVNNQWQEFDFDLLHNRKAARETGVDLRYNANSSGTYQSDPLNRLNSFIDASNLGITPSTPQANLVVDTEGGGSNNEIQRINVTGDPAGGRLIVTYGGETASFLVDATSGEIEARLETISLIGLDNVSVSRLNGDIVITFIGALEHTNVNALQVDDSNLIADVGQAALSYDDNGNITRDNQGNKLYWNPENRLEYITDADDTVIATYIYDSSGRRLAQYNATNTATYYYYEGWEVCLETNASGTAQVEYLIGTQMDAPIAMVFTAGDVYYFHQNTLGNVQAITNASGAVVQRYEYDINGNFKVLDADGDLLADQTNILSPYLYTGRRYNAETQFYYYRNRYYSADLGRFLSTDPLDYVDGMNMYAYVMGNVVNATDPMGLSAWNAMQQHQRDTNVRLFGLEEAKKIEDAKAKASLGAAVSYTIDVAVDAMEMGSGASSWNPAYGYQSAAFEADLKRQQIVREGFSEIRDEVDNQIENITGVSTDDPSFAGGRFVGQMSQLGAGAYGFTRGGFSLMRLLRSADDMFPLALHQGPLPSDLKNVTGSAEFRPPLALPLKQKRINNGTTIESGPVIELPATNTPANPWNAFLKANKGRYSSMGEASALYRQSPWPYGYKYKDNMRTLKEGEEFNMIVNHGEADYPGRFGTMDHIPDVAYGRTQLAIKKGWKETLDTVVTYRVRKPFSVYEGPVGPQIEGSTYLPGGGTQINLLGEGFLKARPNSYNNFTSDPYLEIVKIRNLK